MGKPFFFQGDRKNGTVYGSREACRAVHSLHGRKNFTAVKFGARARVMLFIRWDVEQQRECMQTSEHPFDTIKHYDGAGYFLCKGREKWRLKLRLCT